MSGRLRHAPRGRHLVPGRDRALRARAAWSRSIRATFRIAQPSARRRDARCSAGRSIRSGSTKSGRGPSCSASRRLRIRGPGGSTRPSSFRAAKPPRRRRPAGRRRCGARSRGRHSDGCRRPPRRSRVVGLRITDLVGDQHAPRSDASRRASAQDRTRRGRRALKFEHNAIGSIESRGTVRIASW